MVSLVLSLVAPSLEINLETVPEMSIEQLVVTRENIKSGSFQSNTVMMLEKDPVRTEVILTYLYIFITCMFLVRFIKNILQLGRLIRTHKAVSINNLCIIPIEDKGNPFSFFHFIFIGKEDFNDNSYASLILEHESAHSRQYHSLDILIVEFLSCFYWFNPFIWLYRRAIPENHEFLADESVIASGADMEQYSRLLVNSGNKKNDIHLMSGFNFNQTKNRINMLYSKQSSKGVRIAKVASVFILFAAIFTFSSFSGNFSKEPFVVIVDAGHGGHDHGGTNNEKIINLQMAKHLLDLSSENEVEIILIRDNDRFITLTDRKSWVGSKDADLLLSLHCNYSKNPATKGAEIFYSPKNKYPEESFRASRIITSQILQTTGTAEIKTANFIILKNDSMPSLLLEMGFLSNMEDAQRLVNSDAQKEFAEKIYEGLIEIKKTGFN